MSEENLKPPEPGSLARVWREIRALLRTSGPPIGLCITGISMFVLKDLYLQLWEPSILLKIGAAAAILGLSGLHVWATYANNTRSRKVEQLTHENYELREIVKLSELTHQERCSKRLVTIGDILSFKNGDRISLYKYEEKKFIMLGRHSKRPELSQPGRAIYPADQGVIGKAWHSNDSYCFVDDLPDPNESLDEYLQHNSERFDFPNEVCANMPMKSRTNGAFCIEDNANVKNVAVLVIESLEPSRFSFDELQNVVSKSQRDLGFLLEVLKPLEPSLELARGKGF
ncbi:MAG: hypothetical protein ACAH20_12975 [Methylobacteriaceae bacterium]